MTEAVMILGGYGNFGKRIATGLSARGVPVIIAGRNADKARATAEALSAQTAVFDLRTGLVEAIAQHGPRVIVHTAGQFQGADYAVAETCIAAGVHYIDLSDGRDFVSGFSRLEARAKAAGVTAITGASTVPCLSSAVLDHYQSAFERIEALEFGICPGQGAERGRATTAGILSYVGKPLRSFAGHVNPYGWQGLRAHRFKGLGRRYMGDCDIPDLDLLPAHYGFTSIRFGAGLEIGFIHLGLWALSWGVRLKLMPFDLSRLAGPLLSIANLFDRFGSKDGGMFMVMTGIGTDGAPRRVEWQIIARDADGPQIPSVPAILLAERLARGDTTLRPGAYSSLGLVTLEDYLNALSPFRIETRSG